MTGFRWAAAAVFLAATCATCAACGGTASTAMPAAQVANRSASTAKPVRVPSQKPKPKPKPEAPRVIITRVRASDGSLVTLATFTGPVRYALHDGSADPYAPPGLLRAGPVIAGTERKRLLAAFNGGFKMSAGAGGYRQEGHTLSPLLPGFASLVIARNGAARIIVWPSGRVAGAYSVRQNLRPLVLGGHPTPAAYDWPAWGATLGGGEYVARSAVGEDAHGDLIYAGSMSASPAALAQALARAGARIAMELDINPEWVQLDVARHPGGTLRAEVPGQNRPADQYLFGWSRDFISITTSLLPPGPFSHTIGREAS